MNSEDLRNGYYRAFNKSYPSHGSELRDKVIQHGVSSLVKCHRPRFQRNTESGQRELIIDVPSQDSGGNKGMRILYFDSKMELLQEKFLKDEPRSGLKYFGGKGTNPSIDGYQ
jgi:hypothetical protein